MTAGGSDPAIATGTYPLAGVEYPTSRWEAHEVVRAQYDLFIPPEAAPKPYQLRAQLDDGTKTITLPDPLCSFPLQARP
jgi:hypothetical protein